MHLCRTVLVPLWFPLVPPIANEPPVTARATRDRPDVSQHAPRQATLRFPGSHDERIFSYSQ